MLHPEPGRTELRILWGGPRGPVAGGLSPAVPLPHAEKATADWPAAGAVTAGDHDGDGHAELLVNCWTYIFGPDTLHWWIWEDGRTTRFRPQG